MCSVCTMKWGTTYNLSLMNFSRMFGLTMLFCVLLAASEATLINIRNARKHFEKLERVSQAQSTLAK